MNHYNRMFEAIWHACHGKTFGYIGWPTYKHGGIYPWP